MEAITSSSSTNITQLYRDLINKEFPVETSTVVEDKAKESKLMQFFSWRREPTTQEFIAAIAGKRDNLLAKAMVKPDDFNSEVLAQAKILTEILSNTIHTGEIN